MPREKLKHYIGDLSASQIAYGMNLARKNAQRLFEDANKLLECERFPSAASLAALSIEESGKLKVLRYLAMAPNDDVRRQAWRDYRSHRSKNTMWIVPELYADGARTLDELRVATDPNGDHATILDHVKQLGFYTDCLSEAHWSDPAEVVEAETAAALVEIAGLLTRVKEVTPKEIELWIVHLRPVYGAPLEEMKVGLSNWYEAMRLQGLDDESEKLVRQFIWGTRDSKLQ